MIAIVMVIFCSRAIVPMHSNNVKGSEGSEGGFEEWPTVARFYSMRKQRIPRSDNKKKPSEEERYKGRKGNTDAD